MAAGVETYDWRTGLQPDSRQRIVNKIVDTLKKHLPFSGEEGLHELNRIAVRFEQKIYDAATDQSEYLRKISMKMLTMETKSQKPVVNSLHFNAASIIKNSLVAGNTIDGDWQEKIFQKIKSMNEMYHSDLNDMYLRISAKLPKHSKKKRMSAILQQHDSLPHQQPMIEQLEKLIMFIRSNKDDIQPSYKEKIVDVEKQIVSILSSCTSLKPISALQPGEQALQSQMHTMQEPHMTQMHGQENQMSLLMQQMSTQRNLTNLQHNACQNITATLQPGSNIDPGQGNGMNSNQQLDSVDSSSLAGNVIGGDWQEETYQKIKSMNEMYHSYLNDMYMRTSARLQQHDSQPPQPRSELLDKLRYFHLLLEKLILFMRTSKNDIQPCHKEKMLAVEKQIVKIFNFNTHKAVLQPGQQAPHSQIHAMQQPHLTQTHVQEHQMSSQMQQMSTQGSLTDLDHDSRQNNMDTLQPGSNIDHGQGNRMESIQQVATKIPVSGQMNMNFVLPELKMETGSSSRKRKREHEIYTTGTVDVKLIPKIRQLAEKSKNAASKDHLEEIVRDLSLHLNSSECLDTNNQTLE